MAELDANKALPSLFTLLRLVAEGLLPEEKNDPLMDLWREKRKHVRIKYILNHDRNLNTFAVIIRDSYVVKFFSWD